MPIVGFNFTKIAAERNEMNAVTEKIESDLRLNDVLPEKIAIKESNEVVKFLFEFEIIYGQAGRALLSGNVLYMDEPKIIKEILASWKENRKVKAELMTQVLNAILYRCNIKALNLAQDVNLPPHFKLPRVSHKENEEEEKNPLSN